MLMLPSALAAGALVAVSSRTGYVPPLSETADLPLLLGFQDEVKELIEGAEDVQTGIEEPLSLHPVKHR